MARGSRVRSPPEADTFTAVHREFVGFGSCLPIFPYAHRGEAFPFPPSGGATEEHCKLPTVSCQLLCGRGATTAEKLEGTSHGGRCRSPSCPPLAVPSPSLISASPTFHPGSSLLFFPSPIKFSDEVWGSTVSFPQCPAKNNRRL